MHGESFGRLPFPEAAAFWLDQRKKISPATRKYYEQYIAALTTFFGQMAIGEIDIGNVNSYQKMRQAAVRLSPQYKANCRRYGDQERPSDGASLINHELSCLAQILRRAGRWTQIKEYYEPLPLPEDEPGIALSLEEERHFFECARRRSRWELAYWGSMLSRNTSAGPGEIKGLRLMDLELEHESGPVIHVRKATKTKERKRPLTLNPDALRAVEWMLDRAVNKCGASRPTDYLLPHRAARRGEGWDPARPMGSWKKAFNGLRAEAAKRYPRLATLRPYDMRHTAATDLMEEASVSWSTVEDILGHRIDSGTKRRYNHVRDAKLRAATAALYRGHEDAQATLRFAPAPLKKMPAAVQTPAKPRPSGIAERMAKAAGM